MTPYEHWVPDPDLWDPWDLTHRHRPLEQPPSPYSYEIFQRAGKFWAKNGETGGIEFGPEVAEALIQKVFDLFKTKPGYILVKSEVTINTKITSELADGSVVVFLGKVTLNSDFLQIGKAPATSKRSSEYHFKATIDGQGKANGYKAIIVQNGMGNRFFFTKITGCGAGIDVDATGNTDAGANAVANNTFHGELIDYCSKGIHVKGLSAAHAQGNKFYINFVGANDTGYHFEANTQFCLLISDVDNGTYDIDDDVGSSIFICPFYVAGKMAISDGSILITRQGDAQFVTMEIKAGSLKVRAAGGTERLRLTPGTAGNRGVLKMWDATLGAFKYVYIDNGAWVISDSEPT